MTPRRVLAASLAAIAALALAAPLAQAKPSPQVTVMTRNLYLGGNLLPLALAAPGTEFETATGGVFEGVRKTDPVARMKLVAAEIAKAKPDLVGLQELSLWRTGPKGDPAPAKKVVFDYLATITAELKRLKAHYRVVTVARAFNVEGPTDRGVDVRLTLGNAVLAKRGVKTSHARSGRFAANFQIVTKALGPVNVIRGFNALDATAAGHKFHFVNAHLEAYDAAIRLKQAQELVAGPLVSSLPTVLVGDLNSGPDLPKPEDRPPYQAITDAGFVEARTPKFNCCFNDDLRTGAWDHIVDHILTKPKLALVRSSVTGTKKTKAGTRASDHGGVLSTLRFSG